MSDRKRFQAYAWFFVAYLILVILFGAWVRITHSGAGCGSHWPTCNGEIIPPAPSVETMIEYTHRLTSGLCGVFGVLLVIWAGRTFGWASAVFRAASVSFVFLMIEAGIGAGIVLRELVADNDSVSRAVAVSIHLTNTLLLTGSAAYTAWLAAGGARGVAPSGRSISAYATGLGFIVAISMTGAVTALGDTLFPIEPAVGPGLLDKVAADLSATNHFLVRLRVVHPVVAILGSVYLLWLFAPGARSRGWARFVWMTVTAELLIGVANVMLAAPGWLQLVHLAAAHGLWILSLLASLEAAPSANRVAAPVASAEPRLAG